MNSYDEAYANGWNDALEMAAQGLEQEFTKAFGKDTLASIAAWIREQGARITVDTEEDSVVVTIGGYRLTQGGKPGMIWISNAAEEGGEFHTHELAEVVHRFFMEKF